MKQPKITFSQSIQIWWRFALILCGILILNSAATHFLLWIGAAISHVLKLTPEHPNTQHYQHIHPIILHGVCLLSIAFFIFAQIAVIYTLINHHKKIRSILYPKYPNKTTTYQPRKQIASLPSRSNDPKRLH